MKELTLAERDVLAEKLIAEDMSALQVDSRGTIRRPDGSIAGGSSANPKGRPPLEKERAYLRSMQAIVTLEEWDKVVKKALSQAQAGNRYARDWLARYLVPEPAKALDVGGNLVVEYVNDWRQSR